MKMLYCIRHGTALHNDYYWTQLKDKAYQYYHDTPLTIKGIMEAELLADEWKEIKDISISEGLKAPSLFDMFSVCADTSNRQEAMDRVKRTCELASNLNYERDHGVVVSTLGHPEPDLSWGLSTLLRDQKKVEEDPL